jgi:hypothetical protein
VVFVVAMPALRSAMNQDSEMTWSSEGVKVVGNVLLYKTTAWIFGSHVIVPAVVFGASAYALDSTVDKYKGLLSAYIKMKRSKL